MVQFFTQTIELWAFLAILMVALVVEEIVVRYKDRKQTQDALARYRSKVVDNPALW